MPDGGPSDHQGAREFAGEGSAAAAGVVRELEEGEMGRRLLPRDAAVRPGPGPRQRPDPLRAVDVRLAVAVAVLAAGVAHPGRPGGNVAATRRA